MRNEVSETEALEEQGDIQHGLEDQYIEERMDALRSGEYEQGRSQLCKNGKWCCLGVLCDILAVPYDGSRLRVFGNREEEMRATSLPETACTKTGLDPEGRFIIPVGIGCDTYNSLAEMNDTGVSFSKIADVIEEQWDNLV